MQSQSYSVTLHSSVWSKRRKKPCIIFTAKPAVAPPSYTYSVHSPGSCGWVSSSGHPPSSTPQRGLFSPSLSLFPLSDPHSLHTEKHTFTSVTSVSDPTSTCQQVLHVLRFVQGTIENMDKRSPGILVSLGCSNKSTIICLTYTSQKLIADSSRV